MVVAFRKEFCLSGSFQRHMHLWLVVTKTCLVNGVHMESSVSQDQIFHLYSIFKGLGSLGIFLQVSLKFRVPVLIDLAFPLQQFSSGLSFLALCSAGTQILMLDELLSHLSAIASPYIS